MRHFIMNIQAVLGLALLLMGTSVSDAEESTPPWSQADTYWGAEEMAKSRAEVQASHGATPHLFAMADRLETQFSDGDEVTVWDLQGWYGGDIDKLWVKSEGEWHLGKEVEDAEVQALWSRAVSAFWDVQAGIRYDWEPDSRAHAVLGVQGLAPYWFEVDAAAFLSDEGDLTARFESEYELLLTQRLILQPRAELELSAQDIRDREIGAGFTNLDLGLRLRYEIAREAAPYIGVEWQKSMGETGNIIEAAGGDDENTAFVLGIRAWF